MAALLLAAAVQMFLRPQDEGAASGKVQEATLSLFRPVAAAVDSLRRGIGGLWNRYLWLVAVSRENERLRREIEELRGKLLESRDAEMENLRLRELLRFSKSLERRVVGARVVGHSVSPWFQGIFLDAGTAAGVEPGMAVVTPGGAVGRIRRTYAGVAEVLLLTDTRFSAEAITERGRVRAIAEGMGGELCRLKYLPPTSDVAVGDRVLFSGFDGAMPKGTLLGTVVRADRPKEGLFLQVRVVPVVDAESVEEVLVVLDRPSIPFRAAVP